MRSPLRSAASAHCRMAELDVVQVWSLANATASRELAEACVPSLAGRLADLSGDARFLSNTDTDLLAALLTSVSEHEVAEETKLEMISAWMNSSGRGRGASSDRTAFFDLLLPTVDLRRVPHDFILSVACDEALADLPSSCKPVLAKARREALSASTRRPSHRYAACLPAFPTCNFFLPSLRPIGSRFPFRTRQVVYVYGLEKGDSGRWTLSTLPWDQQRKLQLKAPGRDYASVVMLEGR